MINPAERSLAAIVANVGISQMIDTRGGGTENDRIFNSVVITASWISSLYLVTLFKSFLNGQTDI